MNGVVFFRQRARDLHELHADDAQAALLEAAQNFAGQPALHGVRLDDDERAFHRKLLKLKLKVKVKSRGSIQPSPLQLSELVEIVAYAGIIAD